MPNLGFGELVIVFLIVMLIFGAGRLPQIGEGLGKAIRNLWAVSEKMTGESLPF